MLLGSSWICVRPVLDKGLLAIAATVRLATFYIASRAFLVIKALLDACWSSDCLWEDVDIRFSHPSVSMPAECEARRWRSIMIKYLRKSLKSGRRGRRATPLCKTMEFSYMDSLCKKNPHISMSFTLPVCPFLFFSSCWKPSHFIEQIFESLNRSRADPEPNRHAARLRLRSAGMGSSPPWAGWPAEPAEQQPQLMWPHRDKALQVESIQLRRVQLRRVWGLW